MELFKGSSSSQSFRQPESPNPIKNYFFFYEKEHPGIDLSQYHSNEEKTYFGKLFFSITTLQDMFIGSGEIEKNESRLYDVFSYIMAQQGRRIWNIPGSSLKGCIFTHLSMFLNPSSIDFFSAKEGPAKVFFSDIPMITHSGPVRKNIPERFSPRVVPESARFKLYKKEYIKDTMPQGTYQSQPGEERIMAISSGSRFEGHLHFKQLDVYQIAMLLVALGNFPSYTFNFKMGGGKNRGMGLVKLQIDYGKSFYSSSLRDIFAGNIVPFFQLQSPLESAISKIKQRAPEFDAIIKKLQQEYGQ